MPTLAELLTLAKEFHGSGQIQQAEQIYRQVLAADADNVEALYLLGAACHGLGRLDEAAAHLRQAVALSPQRADAQHLLGVTLAQQGLLDEAISCLENATRLDPDSAEMAKNLRDLLAVRDKRLASDLIRVGKLEEAAACYRRVLELYPAAADTLNNLGTVLRQQGRLDEAADCYRRALELHPNLVEANYNLGTCLADLSQWPEAAECFRRALDVDAVNIPALTRLGVVLQEQGNLPEAKACYRRAVKLKPDVVEAHTNLGVILSKQGLLDEAESAFRRSLELKSDVAETHNNLGLILQQQGRVDEAGACYRQARQLKPDDAESHNNLGTVLAHQSRWDEADTCWQAAIELQPNHAAAHHNRGIALLLLGRFDEGWNEYEWRLKIEGHQEHSLAQPRWTGAPLAGQTILLRAEQGLGDTLQFVRYAPLVKERSGRVIIECHPALARLLTSCAGLDQVIVHGDPLPNFDVQLPLLSLPLCFGTTLENMPAKIPYLKTDPNLVENWSSELGQFDGLKIGIAWQGNPAHPHDRARSFPLEQFADIARLDHVRLYSLQVGAGREQLANFSAGSRITDLGDRLGDFHDTAAILHNLDLVITCDSAPAHLAGALGVKVWLALAAVPDWRWMLDRADSPWYPTMRLFRQPRMGDWASVFQQMEEQLKRTR